MLCLLLGSIEEPTNGDEDRTHTTVWIILGEKSSIIPQRNSTMEQLPFAVDADQPNNNNPAISIVPSGVSPQLADEEGSVLVVPRQDPETIEFAYINVTDEDEVDVWMEDSNNHHPSSSSSISNSNGLLNGKLTSNYQDDVLSLLWKTHSAATASTTESLVSLTEKGHEATEEALRAKTRGLLKHAFEKHGEAAQYFLEAAQQVRNHQDASLTQPLLLLSQSQAEAATALQRILHLPQTLRKVIARKHQPEADLSASTFLRSADEPPPKPTALVAPTTATPSTTAIDEMLELERELRDMDMALAVSSSIASLDARSRRSTSVADSFMVVGPPPPPLPKQIRTKRFREQQHPPSPPTSLDSSVMAATEAASPKQVMQLMDTIRRVGNENANLLRRVEQAEADRQAAVAAKAAMERFQQDYAQRFAALKQHLPIHANSNNSTTTGQEELIRRLTAELKREKEGNRKKDAAIKKYEDFYKAVRARSAEKKKQQQLQEQQKRKVATLHPR